MASPVMKAEAPEISPAKVHLPAPTAWPIVLAFGVALLCAGLVTSASVSILGAILIVGGCAGWFREVLPREREETVEVTEEAPVIQPSHREVQRLVLAPHLSRPLLPLETYPVTAGIKGGLAGSVAMAVLACLYGYLRRGSIWYPINLLAATGSAQTFVLGTGTLYRFHLVAFCIAAVFHLITSLLVGLLYGAMLPMIPRRPILLGGIVVPILWTGLLHSILGWVNPFMNARINWPWFVASQFAFGIVAGMVVVCHHRVETCQLEPFLVRIGIKAPGLGSKKPRSGSR